MAKIRTNGTSSKLVLMNGLPSPLVFIPAVSKRAGAETLVTNFATLFLPSNHQLTPPDALQPHSLCAKLNQGREFTPRPDLGCVRSPGSAADVLCLVNRPCRGTGTPPPRRDP